MEDNEKSIVESTNNNRILTHYVIVLLLLCPVVICILILIFKTALADKEEWEKVAENLKRPSRLIYPNRGNIYSSDGELLVTSVPRYSLYMDFQAGSFLRDSFLNSNNNKVDSLAFHLSRLLKDRSAEGYKNHLMTGMRNKHRNYRIYAGKVSYVDLLKIKQFPFFRYNNSNKTGLKTEEKIERQKLFGSMASRTIGDIIILKDSLGKDIYKGEHGLELYYDSLLQGQAGLYSIMRVGDRWTNVTEVEPVDGFDIQTTIDIQIQDFTEKALYDKVKEVDADLGIAIVMEVRTGEVKAISNIVRTQPGRYAESQTRNHAVADLIEPGSTFKIASMMVAIEDKICPPDSIIETGNGVFHYPYQSPRYPPITDHNVKRGGYGKISVEQAIWNSSNIGVAKVILKGYEKNPAKFIEGLNRVGIGADLNLEIQGTARARIRTPESNLWSVLSLSRMSYGYEVQISPINTLAFFNAIANDGKMIRPIFTKGIQKDGKTIKRFTTETIRSSICSNETLKIIQGMMVNVVKQGTGIPAHSDAISIAGKTGTALIAADGSYSSTYNVSFCGYFPAERPQYSCIIVLRRPRIGEPSGAMPASVFKTIAEKIYSHQTKIELRSMASDSERVKIPAVKNGDAKSLEYALNQLKIKNNTRQIKSEYVLNDYNPEKEQLELKELAVREGLVPNVIGMGAKDAVYVLEKSGLRVSFTGKGQVVSQSVSPGQRAVRGQSVAITLR